MTCEFAHFDGAYVLGALSPADRLAFERHLPTCVDCTRAVQGLAGMPGLLGRVSPDILTSAAEAEPLPETLLPRLVRAAREGERRRTRRLVAIAAAAALVVSAGAATVATVVSDDGQVAAPSTTSEPAEQMTRLGDVPVAASVSLTSVDWGTRLQLTCAYESWGNDDEETGPAYALVIETDAGEVEQVATWRALPGRQMSLDAATATDRGDIRSVEVLTADGRPVLELHL
ncbi:MAG: anti-sigma factor family protein [Nocardioidaceae bacterium]